MRKVHKPKGMTFKDNAIYQGDEFLYMGRQDECAEALNISPISVHRLASRTHWTGLEKRGNKDDAKLAIIVDFE